MKKGDILIYADAGCSVTTNARRELCADILRLVLSKEKLMALLVLHEGSYQPEKKWTKSDLLDYFGYLNNNRVYNSNSVAASFFAIVATAENAEFAENWFRISTNLHLIDDSPSLIETTRILLNIGMIKAFFLCCCKKNLLLRV